MSWLLHMPVLDPAGPVGLGERSVIETTLLLSAIVVVPVFVMLFSFAWKYRASGPKIHAKHEPNWDHDNPLAEAIWWFVPLSIIIALSVLAWRSSHALDPYQPLSSVQPLEVEVVALQWKWLFIYPSLGVASVNLLVIPENTPVHFDLTADAPMNSFWIPALGSQIMVMPGMNTQLNLMANTTGDFNGSSANISGAGFSNMAFTAKSVSPDDFQAWVHDTQAVSLPLTTSSYAALATPSTYVPAAFYAPVDASVYNSIMNKFTMP